MDNQCWCKLENPQSIWWKYLSEYPDKNNSVLIVNINFCPECGRNLKDKTDLNEDQKRIKRLEKIIKNVKFIDEKEAIIETMEMANYALAFVNIMKKLYRILEEN